MFPVFSPSVLRVALGRMSALRAVEILQQMASQDAQSTLVQLQAAALWAPTQVQRLLNIWNWLPTRYVRELNGDNWQYTAQTQFDGGDCEDWSILCCAHLIAALIDARIGLMPDHAAVFVPLTRGSKYIVDQYFQIWNNPDSIPDLWPAMEYKGRLWLPLETTLEHWERGLPGQGTTYIREWARQGALWIARA